MRYLAFALMLLPTVALSDWCDDLWFARNAMFAQAGQCFSSPLGRAYFGGRCTGEGVGLTATQQRALALIQAREATLGCRIDSRRVRELDVRQLPQRRSIPVQPARSEASACVGWRGEPFVLRARPDAGGERLAEVGRGATIASAFESAFDGWQFYEVLLPAGEVIAGWARTQPFGAGDRCAALTG